MKSHFKRLSTFLIVALSFAASQASWGMDENDIFPQFSKLPKLLKKHVLEFDAYNRGTENKHFGSNKDVCKAWKNFYEANNSNNNIKNAWHEGRLVHLQKGYNITDPDNIETLKRVYNGKLIYRPNPTSDEGMIRLFISDLKNPLEGMFDLSKCGDSGQHLSIATGYRKVQPLGDARKVEIWLTPWFLVDKERLQLPHNHHMRRVIKTWNPEKAPVGIFWTWNAWNVWQHIEYCDYLTKEAMEDIGSKNLYEKYGAHSTTTFDPSYEQAFRFFVFDKRHTISHFVFELK